MRTILCFGFSSNRVPLSNKNVLMTLSRHQDLSFKKKQQTRFSCLRSNTTFVHAIPATHKWACSIDVYDRLWDRSIKMRNCLWSNFWKRNYYSERWRKSCPWLGCRQESLWWNFNHIPWDYRHMSGYLYHLNNKETWSTRHEMCCSQS